MIWLRGLNPWSPVVGSGFSASPGGTLPVEIAALADGSVDAILHDPPRFGLAGELYSQAFYGHIRQGAQAQGDTVPGTHRAHQTGWGRDMAGEVAEAPPSPPVCRTLERRHGVLGGEAVNKRARPSDGADAEEREEVLVRRKPAEAGFSDFRSSAFAAFRAVTCSMPPMPPHAAVPMAAHRPFIPSAARPPMASVVRIRLATDDAFLRRSRATLVGSGATICTMSPYSPVWAL